MSIIISPNPTKNNIRVGYIDPELGYIENVSVKQANKYAKNNPGTSFIFTDGGNFWEMPSKVVPLPMGIKILVIWGNSLTN